MKGSRRVVIAVVAGLLAASGAAGQQVGPEWVPAPLALRQAEPPPLRIAERSSSEPMMSLPAAQVAAHDQLSALEQWNAAGRLPVRNGFSRPLAESHRVELDARSEAAARVRRADGGWLARTPDGDLVWGTQVAVDQAARLRLHLTDVHLPPATRFWVYAAGEEPVEFGLELSGPDSDLWTPSTEGDHLFFEVEVPAAALSAGDRFGFTLGEVLQTFQLAADGTVERSSVSAPLGECLIDARCVDSTTLDVIDAYRQAVALLAFVEGGDSYICTGGLLNDTDTATNIPYLLTAHHCFSTQSSASSLEAYWDYYTASCNGPFPNPNGKPKSQGATLLATGAASDFTLVRLNNVPGNRAFLGWTANLPPNGTILHRISHPAGAPQSYSRSRVRTSGVTYCGDAPRPQFLYAELIAGATFGGSSGAPVILAGGYVVGQLAGGCGGEDGCNYANSEVDGAFATTFPSVKSWLAPTVVNQPCVASATTLCIDDQTGDHRFEVTLQFQNANTSGAAHAIPLSSLGVTRGGLFWIGSATNPEMLIKILNACVPALGNKYWVFYAATTNQGLVTTVRDTATGNVWSRTNPLGTAAKPVQDTQAFDCD